MRIAQEEIFGPVLSILAYDDEEDAIRIANGVIYGLAAGVWTRDLNRAFAAAVRLRAGSVWVNAYRTLSYSMPFGGFKNSGIGREDGFECIPHYTEVKHIAINLLAEKPENWCDAPL